MDVRPIHLTFFRIRKRRKYMQTHWFVLRKRAHSRKGISHSEEPRSTSLSNMPRSSSAWLLLHG
jgi:hypothetical protein